MSNSESTTAWVTVAEAAEQAHVDSGTVRQWYRAGRIPTRRSEGERGAFLVPLDLVLGLANPPAEDLSAAASSVPSIEDALRGLGVGVSTAETDALNQELAEAREQVEFLRAQLAEATGETRTLKQQLEVADDQRADLRAQLADAVDERKGVDARLLTLEAELTELRRAAARSSITDNSWLDQDTPAYQSPVRRQAMATPPPPPTATAAAAPVTAPAPVTASTSASASTPAAAPLADGPTAPFSEARSSELAELLAATRPDDDDDDDPSFDAETDAVGRGTRGADSSPEEQRHLGGAGDDYIAARTIWTDEAPHPPLGESPDDLLPEHDRKGRFGKK